MTIPIYGSPRINSVGYEAAEEHVHAPDEVAAPEPSSTGMRGHAPSTLQDIDNIAMPDQTMHGLSTVDAYLQPVTDAARISYSASALDIQLVQSIDTDPVFTKPDNGSKQPPTAVDSSIFAIRDAQLTVAPAPVTAPEVSAESGQTVGAGFTPVALEQTDKTQTDAQDGTVIIGNAALNDHQLADVAVQSLLPNVDQAAFDVIDNRLALLAHGTYENHSATAVSRISHMVQALTTAGAELSLQLFAEPMQAAARVQDRTAKLLSTVLGYSMAGWSTQAGGNGVDGAVTRAILGTSLGQVISGDTPEIPPTAHQLAVLYYNGLRRTFDGGESFAASLVLFYDHHARVADLVRGHEEIAGQYGKENVVTQLQSAVDQLTFAGVVR
jgi:hypothetical protein